MSAELGLHLGLGMAATGRNADFSPDDLSGLKLWLDAADENTVVLNGSNVSQWRDKSGNDEHFSQAVSGYQPAYTEQIDDKNVITFDGVDEYLLNGTILINQPVSVYLVCKMDAIPTAYKAVYFNGGVSFSYYLAGYYRLNAGSDINYNQYPPDLTLAQWTFFLNGASSSFEKNGIELASGNIGSAGFNTCAIGGDPGLNVAAKFCEKLIYNRIVSENEDALIRNYLGRW